MKKKWRDLKNQVLGKNYDLSAVFIENARMKELNQRYRKKEIAANVLSFNLSEKEGEILINKKFEKEKARADYLFLHSILHLKGFRHGDAMEREEKKLIKNFNINFKI